MGTDDIHLHVHEEHGTGGHWCAKIIFFSLMAILMGLVCLIILENRGIQDGKYIGFFTVKLLIQLAETKTIFFKLTSFNTIYIDFKIV